MRGVRCGCCLLGRGARGPAAEGCRGGLGWGRLQELAASLLPLTRRLPTLPFPTHRQGPKVADYYVRHGGFAMDVIASEREMGSRKGLRKL